MACPTMEAMVKSTETGVRQPRVELQCLSLTNCVIQASYRKEPVSSSTTLGECLLGGWEGDMKKPGQSI